MKRFLKKMFVLIVIGLLTYGSYYLYTETDLLRIKHITFPEHPKMSLESIYQYTGVQEGDSFFSVNTQKLIDGILKHPYVKSAEAYKTFPNQITLKIDYREHAFSLHYSDIILSLDQTLHVLSVVDEPLEGYTVEGFSFDNFSSGSVVNVRQLYILENIVSLIELLNLSHLEADPIIEYSDNHIIIKIHGMRARFGNGEDIERRFNAFINIYDALIDEGIERGTIDVSNDGLPVFRPFGE